MANGTGVRPPVSVRSVNCPNCGAATAVRSFGHAVSVVCQNCHSILSANDAGVSIIQQYKKAVRFEPAIPLGTRGRIPGQEVPFEVIGFQVRQITVDGTEYRWSEYLLFNPYRGFRYISEYGGHWNVIATLRALPGGEHTPGSYAPRTFQGEEFHHFQTAEATTVFVLGEFPWQVRVGEKATVADYIAPPHLLSGEMNADKEVAWSLGEYTTGADLWSSLSLPGQTPPATGIFANQPSPLAAAPARMWRTASLLIALATTVWLVHLVTARRALRFDETFLYDPRPAQEASLVTSTFELDGRPSAVRVETSADVENQWLGVDYALINDETGQVFEFAREVSYYSGVDGGERWTEGSHTDAVTIPQVPAGRYFLRLEPEGERASRPVRYRVRVVRDVATSLWFVAALFFVLVPPIMTSFRASGFERRRWMESDHAESSSSSDDDDDDDDDDDGDD